jgi:selenocysteine-specific translation elongation factor
MEATAAAVKLHAAAHPEIIATSSEKGNGIEALRSQLAAFVRK